MISRYPMIPVLLIAAILSLGLYAAPVQAQAIPTVDISPIVLAPFDASGFGNTLAGVTLSLHVIPTSATNKTQAWFAEHATLELACAGGTFDSLKAGVGGALNLTSSEKIAIKAGIVYLGSVDKHWCAMLGISIPLGR